MLDDEVVSKSLRELAREIAEADDPAKLRQLVVEINKLLDAIEDQAARLEGRNPPLRH